MISLKRIVFGIMWLIAILLIGSFGYVILEGWSFFDGFYMTVITLTTVGYGEVRPLSQPAGFSQSC
jgi:voltage-gated potassium channel